MSKFDFDSFDPTDSHSVNISVYKPDGILSFWNWFTRRNKNDSQRKNIKLKINKEDLDKIKMSGFDFQKLQNLSVNSKDKSTRQCNVFAIPKTDLDPFLAKHLQPAMNTKTFVKRLISKSTISVRSKESCANIKYIRTIRSQKSVSNSLQSSKTSFKISMKSNTIGNSSSNQHLRNVFLKSVPTTVLKSNTKKLLVPRKVKSPKATRKVRTNTPPENVNRQNNVKANTNVFPMLLTRKSIEEHLNDVENTTNKINTHILHRNVNIENSQKDLSNTEQSRQKAVKCVASHKIYSKNIHGPRKSKKNRPKKLKNKSKSNCISNDVPSKLKSPNNGFPFSYFSDSSNEFKNTNNCLGPSDIKPGLVFNQYGFTLPNNIAKADLSPENSNDGYDLLLSVVKALTETKGSTNLKQMSSSTTQNEPQYPNISAKLGVVNVEKGNFMSKSTFDWKHTSVCTSSEPLISETLKSEQESFKVKKNISVDFGKQDVNRVSFEKNEILNRGFDPKMCDQTDSDLLGNDTTRSLLVEHRTKITEDTQTCQSAKTVEFPNLGLHYEQRNLSLDNSNKIGFQNKPLTEARLYQENSDHCSGVVESHKETIEMSLEQERFRSAKNKNRTQENYVFADVVGRSEERPLNAQPYERKGSEITVDRGALCSVSIKQSPVSPAALTNSAEKQFKRTTISCSDAQKEPKVSITILVQDSMKDNIEMRSNLLKHSSFSKNESNEQSPKETYSPPFGSFGARGDQFLNLCKTDSLSSLEHLSTVNNTVVDKNTNVTVPKLAVEPRSNKNFYVEVEDDERKNSAEEGLNLGSPGTYLNHEKRKVLEEKVLGYRQSRPLVQYLYEKEQSSPTRSCSIMPSRLTSFDQLIETSIIRQETSFSKTKFNICKENKYNSRTTLKPLENYKRCMFSDESLSAENNFDFSTKYTSQQCFTYSRNNNMANFERPKLTLFRESSLEDIEFEHRKQPFIVVHTPNNSLDTSVVETNNKSSIVRQKGIDLSFREDPIMEVSEEESVVDGNENRLLDSSSSHRANEKIANDARQTQLEYIVASEINRQCPNTYKNGDCRLSECGGKDAEPKKRRESPTSSQTVLSSALVQTDWSLVGITVDHFNLSNNKFESIGCKKRAVAIQTDIMMDQIALMNKDLTYMQSCCKSCMESSQFSELVAYNESLPQAANLQKVQPESLSGDEQICPLSKIKESEIAGVLMGVIKDTDSNIGAYTTNISSTNEDITGISVNKVKSLTSPCSSREYSSKHNLTTQSFENTNNEINRTVKEDSTHRCNIPCLANLHDESILSVFLEYSDNSHLEGGGHEYSTVPEIHAINRSICSYFSSSDEPFAAKPASPTEKSRLKTSDSNSAFCRTISDFDVSDNQLFRDEDNKESQTSLDIPDAAKDLNLDELNLCAYENWIGRLEKASRLEKGDGHCRQETKLEHATEAKKRSEHSKVQARKIGFVNHMPGKGRKRECSFDDKSLDKQKKFLSIEDRGSEKRINSVFFHN